MSETLYPLGLDRLEWAARRELVMSMREARGIVAFCARFVGCDPKKLRMKIAQWQIEPSEYGGEPFPDKRPSSKKDYLREVVRQEVLKALNDCGWNKSKTAKVLGIGRQTLYHRMDTLQISFKE